MRTHDSGGLRHVVHHEGDASSSSSLTNRGHPAEAAHVSSLGHTSPPPPPLVARPNEKDDDDDVHQGDHARELDALTGVPGTAACGPFHNARPSSFLILSFNNIFSIVWHRTSVLVALLLLQSLSQFILEKYEALISRHVIIPLFLTMLVGAGGNAGNQATVRAITGLVTGEFTTRDFVRVLRKELIVGVINAFILASIGFGRVYYFYGHQDMFYSTLAITLSLFCIVVSSVILGTTLPFVIGLMGFDREHAAPIIQVVMDITGVFITCGLCAAIIPDSEGRGPPKQSAQLKA